MIVSRSNVTEAVARRPAGQERANVMIVLTQVEQPNGKVVRITAETRTQWMRKLDGMHTLLSKTETNRIYKIDTKKGTFVATFEVYVNPEDAELALAVKVAKALGH